MKSYKEIFLFPKWFVCISYLIIQRLFFLLCNPSYSFKTLFIWTFSRPTAILNKLKNEFKIFTGLNYTEKSFYIIKLLLKYLIIAICVSAALILIYVDHIFPHLDMLDYSNDIVHIVYKLTGLHLPFLALL